MGFPMNEKSETDKFETVIIWDFPTRLFHWMLVLSISWSWISVEILEDLQQHFWAGYTVLGLLIFRIFWGFVGTYYARLRRLFFRPEEILAYVKSIAHPSSKQYPGHNPLGSLAILAMLALLAAQVGTGLFSTDDYSYGPLASLVSSETIDRLTSLHKSNFELLQILIGAHVLAILAYHIFKKENLTAAMFSGRKHQHAITEPVRMVSSNKIILAIVLIAVSVAAVYVITSLLAEPMPLTNSYF